MSGAHRRSHLSPWARLVVGSAVVVAGAAVAVGTWSLASTHERRVSYAVRGALTGIALDVGDADVVVERASAGADVDVEHVDRYAFGHRPSLRRVVDGGVFRIRSRCPRTVLHGCSVRYRLVVPDNLPLTVHTTAGSVRLLGYRGSARIASGSGDIDIQGFCGFSLRAEAGRGDVSATTACPPPELALRTTTGDVRARVPAGRYRVDASSSGPRPQVRGIASTSDAPFAIQALSSSGRVVVERAP